MNAWIVRILTILAALLALAAALAWGDVLDHGVGAPALVASLVCAGIALVLRLLRPSPARWQALYLGIATLLLATAMVTLLIDPDDVGPRQCGFTFGEGETCERSYSFMAVVIQPATVLALVFVCLGMSETLTPRM